MPSLLRAFAAAAALIVLPVLPAHAADEWIERESSRSIPETVERLRQAIERSGAEIVAVVDHAAAAERAGFELAPATLVVFSNPRMSAPLIRSAPRAALDLPSRILVWEEGGTTRVGYPTAAVMAARYDLPADNRDLARVAQALDALAGAAVARSAADPATPR